MSFCQETVSEGISCDLDYCNCGFYHGFEDKPCNQPVHHVDDRPTRLCKNHFDYFELRKEEIKTHDIIPDTDSDLLIEVLDIDIPINDFEDYSLIRNPYTAPDKEALIYLTDLAKTVIKLQQRVEKLEKDLEDERDKEYVLTKKNAYNRYSGFHENRGY